MIQNAPLMSKTAASAAISTQYGFTNGAKLKLSHFIFFCEEDTTMTEKKTVQKQID